MTTMTEGSRVLTASGLGTVVFVSTGKIASTAEVQLDNGNVTILPTHKVTYLGRTR